MSRLVKRIRPFELVIMRKELKEAIVFILVSVKLLCTFTDGPNFFSLGVASSSFLLRNVSGKSAVQVKAYVLSSV